MGFRKVTKALEVAEQKGQNIRWGDIATAKDFISIGSNLAVTFIVWIVLSIGIHAISPNYLRIGPFNSPVLGAMIFMGFLHYRSEKKRELEEQGNAGSEL